jgi:hypothetical protein
MKLTVDLPDELYDRVKARSALEGRPLPSVAIELFQGWLGETPESTAEVDDSAPWLRITRRSLRPGQSHDMESIRGAIAVGWASEVAEKIATTAQ